MESQWGDFGAVKATVSFAEVLRYYGVEWLRGRRPGQLEGPCPIHRGGRIDAFHVSLSKNAFQCFACQVRGNVLDFVAAMERCSVREAARRLTQRFPVPASGPPPVLGGPADNPNWLGKKKGHNQPLSFTLRGVDGTHSYLRAWGIFPETAARFGVGFYAGRGLMSGRVVIPIHDSLRATGGVCRALARWGVAQVPAASRLSEVGSVVQLPSGGRVGGHRGGCGGRIFRLSQGPPGGLSVGGGVDGRATIEPARGTPARAISANRPDAGRRRQRPESG